MCKKSVYLVFAVLVLSGAGRTRAGSNLVAHYEFEAVGDFSSSVAEDVGEPIGDAQIIWDDERESYVLSLDGDGDYVYFGSEWHHLVDTAITVAAWIKTDSLASYDGIVGLGYAWRLYGGPDGNVIFAVMDTAPESSATGTKNVNDGTWHHVAGSFDGSHYNLYVDGKSEVSVDTSGAIAAGTAYYGCIGAHYKRDDERDPRRFFDGLIDDVRIYNKVLSEAEIWQVFTFVPGRAAKPNPADGQTDVARNATLSWSPGENAVQHDVYFGVDFDDVNDASTSDTTGIYRGRQDANSYTLTEDLEWGANYYWRVDEVNDLHPDSPWKGSIWSFKAANFILVDDFEDYDAGENQIWYAWKDGLGYGTQDTPPYSPGNGTGSAVGNENSASYTEEYIVHGGAHAMPFAYDNNKQGCLNYSEAEKTLAYPRDWTEKDVNTLTLWFRGYPPSVGSFVENPSGTYAMTASGTDIWDRADEFHYAFKTLTGPGAIIAKVESVENTNNWAKAGVMIRETLDAGSKFAAVYITPTNADGTATNGCRLQGRLETNDNASSDSSVATNEQIAITAPYWIKLERDMSGNFRGYYSGDGLTWKVMIWRPSISMSTNVYAGLALTSHNTDAVCEAKFSNVQITGMVSGQWQSQDIGIPSNDPEPMYVALNGSALVYHDNPYAALIEDWTEWNIDLKEFTDQGVDLTDVDKIAIGIGNRNNPQPGGSGTMYFDDIRLYRPRPQPQPQSAP